MINPLEKIQTTLPPFEVPSEWGDELRTLDPRSHEFTSMVGVIGLLAEEEGKVFDPNSFLDVPSQELTPPPNGFLSMEVLPGYNTRIPTGQFENVVVPLSHYPEPYIETGVTELTTDAKAVVRLCDLRPTMPSSVQKDGPTELGDRQRLDRNFYRDLKGCAETGHPKNTVTDVRRVGYTKVGDSKIRAYYMLVEDDANVEGVPTYARLADTSGPMSQHNVYNRVFGKKYNPK